MKLAQTLPHFNHGAPSQWRDWRKISSHLLLLAEESTEAALNALLFLRGRHRGRRGGAHGRLHVQMRRRQSAELSDGQPDPGEVVLVQAVLAAVA